jgi:hypothetical protein
MLTPDRLQALVGKTAAVAYRTLLLAQPDIRTFTVFRYVSPPRLQERITVTAPEQEVIERARLVREQTKFPFWEALFAACLQRGECSDALLRAAFFHHGPGVATEHYRADLESGLLESITDENAVNIGLGSRVTDGRGTVLHLNLLDFHCDISDANTRIASRVCRELMPQGFLLLDSGDSYHAASIGVANPDERIATLGKALLVNPIVDAFYIGHQLQQDSSSIRISKGGRAKQFPKVIDAWCGD